MPRLTNWTIALDGQGVAMVRYAQDALIVRREQAAHSWLVAMVPQSRLR